MDRSEQTKALFVTLRTLGIATAGGWLFYMIGMPMPWMLGPLALTIVASQIMANVRVPTAVRDWLQPVLGVTLGSFFTPAIFSQAGSWASVLCVLVVYIAVASALGFAYFTLIAGYDRKTAFVCAVPGGFNELAVIGSAIGANIIFVGLSHAVRVVTVVATMPIIITFLADPLINPVVPHANSSELLDLLILSACGLTGYCVSKFVPIAAGALLFPLLISAAAHLLQVTESSLPFVLVASAQIAIASFVGARFGNLRLREFRTAVIHGLVWVVILTAVSVTAALIAAHVADVGVPQLVLAYAPGGIAEMGLLTLSLGIDVAMVTVCHVLRILVVVAIAPLLAGKVHNR